MKKKKIGSKGKISIFYLNILKMFLTDTLAKMSKNIFAYSLVSENSDFFFLEKSFIF